MSIRIVTDSTCDLPDAVIRELEITVIRNYINIGEHSYLDGVELSREEFYSQLSNHELMPTTSAPGMGAFIKAYEQLADEGASEIISIHVSANLSNIFNVAKLAAQATARVRVMVFDSGQLTIGTGLLAIAAAKAAGAGGSTTEIVEMLDRKAARVHSFAALDTLEYLHRSGRLSKLQFSVGALLDIKPVIRIHRGELTLERVRTWQKAINRLIELVEALGPAEHLAIVHAHAPHRARLLKDQTRHLFPPGADPFCVEVTPVIGTHVGPGAVGLVSIT